jgi:hypothetical protein
MGKNYIIRTYQQEKETSKKNDQGSFVGIIEEPLTGQRQSFHTAEELWSILSDTKPDHNQTITEQT